MRTAYLLANVDVGMFPPRVVNLVITSDSNPTSTAMNRFEYWLIRSVVAPSYQEAYVALRASLRPWELRLCKPL
jgi:hypothetical protein